MKPDQNLMSLIQATKSGKSYPAMSLVKENPLVASLISKMIKSTTNQKGILTSNNASAMGNATNKIAAISNSIAQRVTNTDNILQLFPDIELATQILISSILSPKDMVASKLIYRTTMGNSPPTVTSAIMNELEKQLNEQYKLDESLPIMLKKMLFISGSHCEAVIPESSLDALINGSMTRLGTETYTNMSTAANTLSQPLGLLGAPTNSKPNMAMESLFPSFNTKVSYSDKLHANDKPVTALENLVSISDNYELLKLSDLVDVSRSRVVSEAIRSKFIPNIATESTKLSGTEFASALYKSPNKQTKDTVVVSTNENTKRRSIGRPLHLVIPSEAVVPVSSGGKEGEHVGCFILLGSDGKPVTDQLYSDVNENKYGVNNGSPNQDVSSMLLARANLNLTGDKHKDNLTLPEATAIYADIVETDLLNRLRSGVYGSDAKIAHNNDFYKIMLARAMANQSTRVLFIPKELISYFAFRYHKNGVGKSLLDDLMVMVSLRSMLLFAKVRALTKNAIATTNVNLTLDPDDPDPRKSMEMVMSDVMMMQQQYFPVGINAVSDLADWVVRAGVQFSFDGHPSLPAMKLDFQSKNAQNTVPDSDLDDTLRKQTFMHFGIPPEIVDAADGPDFAITVASNNIMMSKRILQYQELLSPQLSNHVRRIVENDFVLSSKIAEIINNNLTLLKSHYGKGSLEFTNDDEMKTRFMIDFMLSLKVELPKPDITSVENQSTAFKQYSDALDEALNAWLNSDFISDTVAATFASNVDMMKATYKAYFLRKWMNDNNYMTELIDMVSLGTNENKVDISEINKGHLEAIIATSVKYITGMQAMAKAAESDLDGVAVPTVTDSSSGDDGSNISSDEDLPEAGGADDFSLDTIADDAGVADEASTSKDDGDDSKENTNTIDGEPKESKPDDFDLNSIDDATKKE